MTPVDLVRRPGWRTIVTGARQQGTLIGFVARFEWEGADMNRNCHNLRNMQVQLQNLLDGVVVLLNKANPPNVAPALAPAATTPVPPLTSLPPPPPSINPPPDSPEIPVSPPPPATP